MEEAYIKRIIRGDITLYTYFVDKYKDMAYTIAFRITANTEDAEEVVQDSFLKAYNALNKFKAESTFSTWFYRIVVNTALTRSKRKLSTVVHIGLNEVEDDAANSIEGSFTNLVRSEQKRIIQEVLNELEMEDNLLLTLYYLNGNSIEEIFEITSIPTDNIKMKLHRARKKMYRLLDKKLRSELQYLL